jgi:hypothetical protein
MFGTRFEQSADGTNSPSNSVVDWQFSPCRTDTDSPVRHDHHGFPLDAAEGILIGCVIGCLFWALVGVWMWIA